MAYRAIPAANTGTSIGETILNPAGGTVDDSAVLSALLTAGAKNIRLGSGTFNWKSSCVIGFDGIHIEGNGQQATFISIDDSGGNIGDAFKVNSVLDFSLKGLTVTATSARSAGSVVKVLGANNITHSPVQKTQQYVIEDVNWDSQFNGVVFNDSAGGAGAWGGHINRCQVTATSAGGVCIWVNSPSGGQHYISNVKAYNDNSIADASRALAAIRYQGGADLELVNINTVYFRHGLLVDPPNGQAANVITATACLWDNNTLSSVKIAPQAGGSVLDIELNGGWGYTPAATSQPCVEILGGTSIAVRGGKYQSCFQAFNIFGPAKYVTVANVDCGGSTAGIYASLNATDFSIIGNTCGIIGGVTPTVGIQVDAGCNHYNIVGNVVRECTTPITNTPGTSAGVREVANNITA